MRPLARTISVEGIRLGMTLGEFGTVQDAAFTKHGLKVWTERGLMFFTHNETVLLTKGGRW